MNTEPADVYTRITNQIVEAIEEGAADWRMPWHPTGKDSFAPQNAAMQKRYRRVNVLSLWAAAQKHGYSLSGPRHMRQDAVGREADP